jgi:peptidoglycan hydrolase-like protein with peptidoglycan-binding domain/lysophospholipase L1-like esterase
MTTKKLIIGSFFFVSLFLFLFTYKIQAQSFQSAPAITPLSISRPLYFGVSGKDVAMLQNFLKDLGYFKHYTITNYFGFVTKKAVVDFQKKYGIDPIGIVGPKTRAKITELSMLIVPKNSLETSGINTTTSTANTPLPFWSLIGGPSPVSTPVSTPDTTAPTISMTVPSNGATVGGSLVTLTATTSDNVAVAGVKFYVNGGLVGSEITTSPYSMIWDSTATSSGSKIIVSVARDTSNNVATSGAVTITVDNTSPIISSISSGTPGLTSTTVTWTTDEAATSRVVYGTTSSYGSASTSAAFVTSHSVGLTGLTSNTTYHFAVVSTDALGNIATSTDQTFTTATPSLPSGALGIWYMDQYASSPRPMVANAASATSTSANLFAAPRKLFANSDWWSGGSATISDSGVTAPDGSNTASTVTGTGNWFMHPTATDSLPAGTYTMAVWAKRNTGTDQQFTFYRSNTGIRSSAQTTTSAWQRFSWTFTTASPAGINLIGLGSIDGSTAGNIQITDFELYSGSTDLGSGNYGGHLYLGSSAYDTRPSYTSGALDLSSNGYGLIQFPTDQTFTNITVQALVSKVAAGTGYQSILSKAQSYTALSAMTEQSTAPYSYFNGSGAVAPEQGSGLWVASGKGYHVITLRYDGTKFDYWVDDVRVLTNTVARSPVTAADLFVNLTNTTSLYGGNKFAGALALWNRALSDGEIRDAVSFQQTRASLSSISASNANRILVAEGDSITAAFNAYPYVFGPNANPALYGVNYAVSGSTISSLNTRASAVDAVIPPSPSSRTFILSVLIGANGLSTDYSGPGGTGVSGWLADLATYLDARRAAGWKVVLCTVLPRTTPDFNAARNTANATIATWGGVHADAICDFAADPTMGTDAAASNTTYYSDGTHPTATGQTVLEPIYRAAVNSI